VKTKEREYVMMIKVLFICYGTTYRFLRKCSKHAGLR